MEIANFFWDGEMSNLEKNCIKSFVRNGFKVKLWSYNGLVVDGTESCDANLILEKSYMSNHNIKQQHDFISIEKCKMAAFSDYFRFKLISEHGGWWFDTDCFCLKNVSEYTKIKSNHDLVSFYEEDDNVIACGVFYLKKGTILSNLIMQEFNNLLEIEKGKVSKWATFGPKFFTNFINKYNLLDGIFDTSHCYSIHWNDVDLMLYPQHLENAIEITKGSFLTHIWTPTFSEKNIDKNNPIEGSFLHKLYII
jgi:hypothetical protein